MYIFRKNKTKTWS